MKKSLIKCNLIWVLLSIIVGFTGFATLKPDLAKELLTQNAAGFVDLFNLRSRSVTEEKKQETYTRRTRSRVEPSVFEQSE